MTLRTAAIALVVALVPVTALAQAYPVAPPAPRTTSPARLDEVALNREVAERFRRGLAAEAVGDWAVATAEFRRAIALDPPEPGGSTARYDLGIALAGGGDYRGADAAFADALRRDPGFAAAAANRVEVALLAGDLPQARSAADRFLAIAPASLRAHYGRGLVALHQNDAATAQADFGALIVAAPGYAVAHYDLALAEIAAARYDDARNELQIALALSPDYARARFALATILVRDDRRGEAAVALAQVERDAADPSLRALAAALRERLTDPRP